jgi:hypothetical protein
LIELGVMAKTTKRHKAPINEQQGAFEISGAAATAL